MGKLSGLTPNSAPVVADKIVIVKNSGPVDTLVAVPNFLALAAVAVVQPYKFLAYLNASNQTLTSTSPTKVTLNAEAFDTGSNFDSVTNFRFVAPIAGTYNIYAVVNTTIASTNSAVGYLYKNGAVLHSGESGTGATLPITCVAYSGLIQLAAGDYLELWVSNSFGTGAGVNGGTYGSTVVETYMSGSFYSA